MFWQRQRVAGIGRLIDGGRKIFERVAVLMMPPRPERQRDDYNEPKNRNAGETQLPIHLGHHQCEMIHKSFFRLAERRGLAEIFRAAQFRVQHGDQRGGIQLERTGVIPHRAADVNRRGKHVEISLFERADVVGADFGHVRDLFDREFFGLARGAELFGDR